MPDRYVNSRRFPRSFTRQPFPSLPVTVVFPSGSYRLPVNRVEHLKMGTLRKKRDRPDQLGIRVHVDTLITYLGTDDELFTDKAWRNAVPVGPVGDAGLPVYHHRQRVPYLEWNRGDRFQVPPLVTKPFFPAFRQTRDRFPLDPVDPAKRFLVEFIQPVSSFSQSLVKVFFQVINRSLHFPLVSGLLTRQRRGMKR